MKLFTFGLALFLMSGFFLGLGSCSKETACIASVRCIDSAGNGVSDVYVMLYALVKSADGKSIDTADIRTNGTTDAEGKVKFTFKLPAIYDINAVKYIGSKKFTANSVISLQEGQTVEKDVKMHY